MSFFISVVVRRDEMMRALRRARLWGPAGKKQVLHKLKLRQGSHLLSHKKQGAKNRPLASSKLYGARYCLIMHKKKRRREHSEQR